MVDSRITEVTALTGASLATTDVFEVTDISDTTMDPSGTSKKITADDLATSPPFTSRRARVLDEAHADAGSASSTAEQTLASLTLPAGVIAAGDTILCFFCGDRLNNSGSSVNYTWKFKIGATTVVNSGAISLVTGGNRTPWSAQVNVVFAATNAERALLQLLAASSGATIPQTTAAQSGQQYGTAAEDSTSALTVAFTCTLSASNALTDVILHAASMVLVKK